MHKEHKSGGNYGKFGFFFFFLKGNIADKWMENTESSQPSKKVFLRLIPSFNVSEKVPGE